MCGQQSPHSHDLRLLGRWHFIWRYQLQDKLIPDGRPYPPVNAQEGATSWFTEYQLDWMKAFVGYQFQQQFVRDEQGVFVWVTNTPPWDRDWFDKRGWRFPAKWITVSSKEFYRIGFDALTEVVKLPTKGAVSASKVGSE